MKRKLLDKTRKINTLLQESSNGGIMLAELCHVLEEVTEAKCCIVSRKGKIIGAENDKEVKAKEEFCQKLLDITEPEYNISVGSAKDIFDLSSKENSMSVVPIIASGQRIGSLIFVGSNDFDLEEQLLAEYGAALAAAESLRRKSMEREEQDRDRETVQQALSTLSYSELEAVIEVFRDFNSTEDILVASRIASEKGITKSVIVNSLRKLESAGVIESSSLGKKGTHIKVLKPRLLEEISRYAT